MTKPGVNGVAGLESRALADRMGDAASRFLASLAGDQRTQATFAFNDPDERTRWFYTPRGAFEIERLAVPLSL